MAFLAEVFCHGQAGFGNAHTGSRRFVHLAEDQGGLVQNAGSVHFAPKVTALTAALANAGKDGVAAVLGGYVVDQLLDQHGFANTGAAKQADLAALGIRCQQVNDLDAGFQNFGCRFLVLKAGGLAMDGPGRDVCGHGAFAVNGAAQGVKHAAQGGFAHRGSQAVAQCVHGHPLAKTLAGRKHNAANGGFVHMLRYFHRALGALSGHCQRFLQGRQLALGELNVHHGACYTNNCSLCHTIASSLISEVDKCLNIVSR